MLKKTILIFLAAFPLVAISQKKAKAVKCDSITCDQLVYIAVSYPDTAATGDCIKMIKDTMIAILFDKTPLHKANFLKLAKEGFYNGTTFHRVIDGFMIQGGDPNSKDANPNNDGQGGPGYTVPAEILPELTHKRYAIAAARMPDQINPKRESSGSQFYIVQNAAGTPQLNGAYTVFGELVKGFNAVNRIAKQGKDQRDRPIYNIKMTVWTEQIPKKTITEKYGFVYP